MIVLLCGFSGAGKTSLLDDCSKEGKRSESAAVEYIDLDGYIAEKLQISSNSLGEFIGREGFAKFREIERSAILELCDKSVLPVKNYQIISLGGGTLDQELMERFKKSLHIKTVWLDRPFESCYEWIVGDSNRPLASLEKGELQKLFVQRAKIYRQSDLHLHPTESIENFTKSIFDLLFA